MAVSVPRVFVKMGILMPEKLREWQQGRVPYLERVVMGSLGKTNRIVRIVSLYAHDLKLPPAPPHAAGPITHAGRPLRFSKTGVPKLEAAYKRVFSPRPPDWKPIAAPTLPSRAKSAVEQADAADEARFGGVWKHHRRQGSS
jgi:hypothetical protein